MTEGEGVMGILREVFGVLGAAGLAVMAAPAIAQAPAFTPPEGNGPEPICRVIERSFEEGARAQLVASCRGRGFMLGPADSYEVHQNHALEAAIIDLTWGGERRVIMISFPGGEEPLLEDITATLARSAGRGAMGSLDGVAVDLSAFAAEGRVTASDPAVKSGEINLGQQIAAESARSMAARSQAPAAVQPASEPEPAADEL